MLSSLSLSLCKNLKLGFFLFFLLFYFLIFNLPCHAASWTAEERAGWQYHQKLTLNNKDQNENLTDFPVLVKLNPTRFNYAQAKDQGEDIRFLDSDNQTLLSYEIEKWQKDGESFIWVKVPQIDASSQADFIYMYWGNPKAADGQNSGQVWSNGFAMVQHLKETSGTTTIDSTANGNNGTKVSATEPNPTTSGQINGAQDFDGTNDYINVGNKSSLEPAQLTVSAWIKSNNVTTLQKVAGKFGWASNTCAYGYSTEITTDSKVAINLDPSDCGNTNRLKSTSSISTGTWYHVVGTYDGTTAKIYLNGNLENSGSRLPPGYFTNFYIGVAYSIAGSIFYDNFNGLIDEVTISNTTRSSTWISAEYKSMNDEFITFGSDKGPSLKIGEGSSVFDRYALTDNGMPSFIFSRFKDESYTIHKYSLEVDGSTFIDFIPANPKDKNHDNLVNENEKDFEDDEKYVYYTDDYLTVRSKKKVLLDGPHSWQAKAVNSAGNTQSTLVNYLLVNTHQCNFSNQFFPLVLNGITGIGSNLNHNWKDADYSKTRTFSLANGRFVNRPYSLDNPLFSLWGIAPMATSVRLTLKDPTTQEQVFRGSTTTNASSQWGINIDQALTPDSSYTAILESANEKGDYIQLPEFKVVIK